ncbi:MAG: tetratricopeptide repeat protein [Bdellovibrionales bacterium]|nr:tetratricopeptide repeat protein [Bdellovibrionales bacterium]
MALINSDFIEKYQLILEQQPHSKVFAPLAEAYRKMGLFRQAKEICERGVKANPDFASGRVAYAHLLVEQENYESALSQLKEALSLAPENILAHNLLAETYLHLKRPKDALKSYKMVLFLNPQHLKAQKAVQKLESLTADEYDDDLFALKKLSFSTLEDSPDEPNIEEIKSRPSEANQIFRDRHFSLIDAFIARSDFKKAQSCLKRAVQELGELPELIKRQKLINRNLHPTANRSAPTEEGFSNKKKKIKKLEHLLKNISFNEKIE